MDYLDVLDPLPFIVEVDGELKTINPAPIFEWFREEVRVRESLTQYCAGKWGTALELFADAFESVTGLDPFEWSYDDIDVFADFVEFFMDVYMPPELSKIEGSKELPEHANTILLELEAVLTTQLSLAEFRGLTFSHALVLYVKIREEQAGMKEVMWLSGTMGWNQEDREVGNKIITSYKPRPLPWMLPWSKAASAAPPRLTPPDENHLSPFIKNPGKVRDLKKGTMVNEAHK